MNENLQRLETKVENQGSTSQGKVSAAEWNILVEAVKALDAAGIDIEALTKYLKQYQYITTPELEELLKDVTENLDGVVDLKSAQTIEGLKDFINGFKIGGALVKYDTTKKCFIFTENVLMEKGLAWNSRFEDFTKEEIFNITKAVDVDWKTIGKNAAGQLYVISGGGEGGGGNYDPDFLHNYLTNNKYITQPTLADTLQPYATTADVNSVLTEYLPKSGGTVNGNITAQKFIGDLQGTAERAAYLPPNQLGESPNLNDYKTGGLYSFYYAENAPAPDIATMLVIPYSLDWGAQIYFGTGSTNIYYRKWQGAGGVFQDHWREIAFTDTDTLSPSSGALSVNGNIISSGVMTSNGFTIPSSDGRMRGMVANHLISSSGDSDDIWVYNGVYNINYLATLHNFYGNILASGNVAAQSVIINGKTISYNADKNAFVLPANLLVEGGIAWNSRFEDFTEDEIFTITKAVSIDGTSIIRDGGVLRVNPDYIQSVGGLNENELERYLEANKYITQLTLADTLQPYATTADVNSVLTEYLPKSGGTVNGNIAATKFIGDLQGTAERAAYLPPNQLGENPNLNDYKTGGLYSFYYAENAPAPDIATMLVLNYSPDWGAQIYFGTGSSNIYYRKWQGAGGVFQDHWREIAFTDTDTLSPSSGALSVNGNIISSGVMTSNGFSIPSSDGRMCGMFANQLISSSGDSNDIWVYNGVHNINYYATLHNFYGNVTATGSLTVATNVQIPATGDRITFCSAKETYTKGVLAMNTSNTYIEAPLVANEKTAQKTPILIGWRDSTYPVFIAPNTNVAIGGTTASEKLHVHGNILATGRIAWNSSRVLKTEVKEHYLALEKLAQIKPYRYKWKDGRDDLVHVGAIADEVMEIMPETVLTDSLGIHSMDYAQTAFVMAASLTPHVSDHERRIKDLELENEALKEEIAKLKNVV